MSSQRSTKTLSFLQKLNANKDILFGKFSGCLTQKDKQEAWEDLRQFSVNIGLITCDKDYKHVRETTWGNLRKKTMKKLDPSKRTGAEGGPQLKLDEIDELVLNILGKESPAVQGLGIRDSLDAGPSNVQVEQLNLSEEDGEADISQVGDDGGIQSRIEAVREKDIINANRKRVVSKEFYREMEELKKTKIKIEIENLKLEQTKLKLEIEHLEIDLKMKKRNP